MLSYVYIKIVSFLCCYNNKSTLFNSDLSLNQHYISYDVTISSRAKRSLSTLCKILHTYKQKAK